MRFKKGTVEPATKKSERVIDPIDVEYRRRCIVSHPDDNFQRVVYGLMLAECHDKFSVVPGTTVIACQDTFDPSDFKPGKRIP